MFLYRGVGHSLQVKTGGQLKQPTSQSNRLNQILENGFNGKESSAY